MTKHRQIIGRWGESIAAAYLERKGYLVIDRNITTPVGEIDILASKEESGEKFLIFVEVKTRTSHKFGNPEDAMTQTKWNHLIAAINEYLADLPEREENWQVDVVAVQKLSQSIPPDIQHFENVNLTDDPY